MIRKITYALLAWMLVIFCSFTTMPVNAISARKMKSIYSKWLHENAAGYYRYCIFDIDGNKVPQARALEL